LSSTDQICSCNFQLDIKEILLKLDVCCIFSNIFWQYTKHLKTSCLGSCEGSYFQPTNQRWAYCVKPSTQQELLSDWLLHLTVLHMIGRSKMNERFSLTWPQMGCC